jgi:glycosyltransferase involved in cell wall biosynthesis
MQPSSTRVWGRRPAHMKRVLILTPAPLEAASTRFRIEQFRPALRDAGIETVVSPFLDEGGWRVIYRKGLRLAKAAAALRALTRRLGDLVRATRADAVLVHREAALVGPPVIEWVLARVLDRPLLFDLDDPVWVAYASPTYGRALSALFKAPWKANFTLGVARQVIAGNPYVAAYARRLNGRVDIVPTVVDTTRFVPARRARAVPVVGWIGTHSTVSYLSSVVPALRRVARQRPFLLRVVGGQLDAPGLDVECRPWRLDTEVADFQELDVGLYPIQLDSWSVGKSGFKAIQYMACAVPVVASPIGVTRDIVRDDENGFLAADEDGWVRALSALLDDAELRRRIGDSARADAESNWSLHRYAPRFVELVARSIA